MISRVRHHGMARPQVSDGGTASNMEGSSRGQPTRGGPPAWGLGEVLTNTTRNNMFCNEMFIH